MAIAGNYCLAKRLANGNFLPLYFGEGGNLKTRLPDHEKLQSRLA